MAKNTKQIGLLQQRFGKLNELPKQLVKAQFGFADDKNRLFIGNPEHPTLKERYESNTFPYGNVEILTEFSDLTNLIKYSPWMNGRKIHYPITILGSNVVDKVPVGSSFFVNDQEIEFTDEGVVVTDYDYLVLRYIWTDGRDLDTETFITNANNIESINNKRIGWFTSVHEHEGDSVPRDTSITNSVMYWSGDNTGEATIENPQEENILISRINLDKEEYYSSLPEIINIELQGTWFNTVGHNPVRMEIYAYKGGVMTTDEYRYVNEGGEQLYFIDEYGDTVDHLYIEVENLSEQLKEYRTLGYININKESGATAISVVQNDTTNNTSSNTRKEISLDLAVKQINNSKVNIEAKNVNGHIQLKTTEEELVLENGKTVDGYPPVLEIFGFDGIHELAISPTKRTLQEVLDDRYSIKSFDVLGDGVTNDGYYINIAMEILYDYIKSDPKELYFPADKYIVNDTSLILYKNTHLVGEGIDRTIIKTTENQNPLLVIADGFNRKTDFRTDDEEIVYPENILIEEMTFDISKSSSQTILLMKTSSNITFRNCKFICNTNSNVVRCLQNNDILKNIKFENCIFEGNNSVKDAINISCELNSMLITNSEFNNFKNSVLSFNGVSDDKLIENIIIANNRFNNCSKGTHYLAYANENTRYISFVKSLVDQDVLMEEDGYKVLNTLSDLNYCDTPIYSTDPNKFLRFHFYQSIYDYVQALYNKFGKTAFEVISPETDVDITNYIKLIQGNNDNENTLSINATSQTGDVEINMGKFGDLHLGKDSNNIDEWKENHKYNALELVYYENYLYRCIETHISSDNFSTDSSKWKLVENNELDEWIEEQNYEINDIVVFNDDVYVCIANHRSSQEFDSSKWHKIGSIDADIVLHKDLDLNGNAIESRDGSDIVFKTNNNVLMIDNSKSETPYEDRIADKDSAIPTVKYLNDTVNSCVRKKFDVQTINEQVSKEESSEIELVNFKSESFGNDVYLKNVSVNVRQLFIPVNEQIRGLYPDVCKYLDWTNKIMLNEPNYYDVDDVVEIYVDDPNDPDYKSFKYYKCIVSHEATTDQSSEYNNFMVEFNLGYWEEVSGSVYYEAYSSEAFEYVTWYKGDVVKTLKSTINDRTFPEEYGTIVDAKFAVTLTEDHSDWLYSGCIRFTNGTLGILITKDFNWIKDKSVWEAGLNDSSLNSMYYVTSQNRWYLTIASDQNHGMEWSLCSAQGGHGLYILDYASADTYNDWNNGEVDSRGQHTVITSRYSYEISNNGKVFKLDYNNGTSIITVNGFDTEYDEIRFYLCLEDHEASVLYDDEESLDNDITKGYWQEIILDVSDVEYAIDVSDYDYTKSDRYLHLTNYIGGSSYVKLPELLETIRTLPDLRYVSIISVDNLNRETKKWLFNLNDVNLIYRNTNGYTYPLWQPNTTYNYGDMVRYNYSNFKCIAVSGEGNFTRDYGNFTDIKFTVAPDENRQTYVYTGSIHLESGTLPIIIRKDGTEPEIRMSYFSNEIDSRFNGGYYLRSKRAWINTIADDGTDWMEWLDAHSQNHGNMAYSTATAWNWDNGKTVQGHPSVYTDTFTGEISDDGKILKIYKEGVLFYTLSQLADGTPTTHISGTSRIDLHNSNVWKKLNEPGFDYQFNFERSLYEKEDGKLVEEDYQFTHNFADHTLKLGLYDENGEELVVLNKDNDGLFIERDWQPNTVYYTHNYIKYNNKLYVAQDIFSSGNTFTEDFLQEVVTTDWNSYTEYFEKQYIKNGNDIYEVLEDYTSSSDVDRDVKDKYLKIIPSHYVQLGATGEMLVTVNYAKGN